MKIRKNISAICLAIKTLALDTGWLFNYASFLFLLKGMGEIQEDNLDKAGLMFAASLALVSIGLFLRSVRKKRENPNSENLLRGLFLFAWIVISATLALFFYPIFFLGQESWLRTLVIYGSLLTFFMLAIQISCRWLIGWGNTEAEEG